MLSRGATFSIIIGKAILQNKQLTDVVIKLIAGVVDSECSDVTMLHFSKKLRSQQCQPFNGVN